jgi:hypothetical protein
MPNTGLQTADSQLAGLPISKQAWIQKPTIRTVKSRGLKHRVCIQSTNRVPFTTSQECIRPDMLRRVTGELKRKPVNCLRFSYIYSYLLYNPFETFCYAKLPCV